MWRGAPVAKGLVGGMLGVLLTLLVWHVWTDHVALHQIIQFINVHGAKIQHLDAGAQE